MNLHSNPVERSASARDHARSSADKDTVRARVSDAEWQARTELAAVYRIIAHYNWTDTIYTHISARVPDEPGFLINPWGLLYDEITASALVKVDVDGRILDDPVGLGINAAGFVIHGAIHAARHDIAFVIHTHTRAGAAVSAQEHGLLPISQHATYFTGGIAYHDSEGIAIDRDEQVRLVKDLGNKYLMILRNHGLLVAGRSPGEALFNIIGLERACEIQIAALAGGSPLRKINPAAAESSAAIINSLGGNFNRDWAAMLRLADRVAPDYRN